MTIKCQILDELGIIKPKTTLKEGWYLVSCIKKTSFVASVLEKN